MECFISKRNISGCARNCRFLHVDFVSFIKTPLSIGDKGCSRNWRNIENKGRPPPSRLTCNKHWQRRLKRGSRTEKNEMSVDFLPISGSLVLTIFIHNSYPKDNFSTANGLTRIVQCTDISNYWSNVHYRRVTTLLLVVYANTVSRHECLFTAFAC